jgi:hypothetical protein
MAEGPAARLAAARDLSARAADMSRALDRASAGIGAGVTAARPRVGRGRAAAPPPVATVPVSSADGAAATSPRSGEAAAADDAVPDDAEAPGASASAAERRRAATIVIGLWRDLVRDLLLVRLGDEREVRDAGLLDDLRAAAARLGRPSDAQPEPASRPSPDAALATFLARLDTVGELVEANTRPELALDSLLLAWPRSAAR